MGRLKDLSRLWLTLLFASGFLVKFFEYAHKIHEHILPGKLFAYEELKAAKAPLFFSVYFVMTGIDGLHVIIGMGIIYWLIVRSGAQ